MEKFIIFDIKKTFISIVLFLIFLGLKKMLKLGIRKFGERNEISVNRIVRTQRLTVSFMGLIFFFLILLIWGIKIKEFFILTTTTFTIIGAALFASWSNLSNISSGLILFFYYNLKQGDKVRIGLDDSSVVGTIIDMKLYFIEISVEENRIVYYPNNLALHDPIEIIEQKGI